MKIAVEGCCHGELDKIYETLAYIESRDGVKVDLLLICGDFQAVRNESDLCAMAVPQKYREMNTFYKYYSGEKTAPVLTLFIGGNHEASNYLQELPYGGWVAPNIYYLGYAGVVTFGGLRLAGLSGIYKGKDYARGHYEHPPYNEETKRSCYHIRNIDVFRLKQLKQPIDIFLSHDWPEGVCNYGDKAGLLKRKPYFAADIDSGKLGSRPAAELLHHLKPSHWFSAHLHVKFAAIISHQADVTGSSRQTKFLALDKCLPRRQFLQVLDIEPKMGGGGPLELCLDPEWMCILRSTNHLLRLTSAPCYMPGPGANERYDFTVTNDELNSLREDFGGIFKVPPNFVRTVDVYIAPPANQPSRSRPAPPAPQICINPQTTLLCDMLALTDPYAVFSGHVDVGAVNFDPAAPYEMDESDSLDVDDRDEGIQDDSDFINDSTMCSTSLGGSSMLSVNPDEISIDDTDDDEDDGDRGVMEGGSSPPTEELMAGCAEGPLTASDCVEKPSTSSSSRAGERSSLDTQTDKPLVSSLRERLSNAAMPPGILDNDEDDDDVRKIGNKRSYRDLDTVENREAGSIGLETDRTSLVNLSSSVIDCKPSNIASETAPTAAADCFALLQPAAVVAANPVCAADNVDDIAGGGASSKAAGLIDSSSDSLIVDPPKKQFKRRNQSIYTSTDDV